MAYPCWLSDALIGRLDPDFPKSHGQPLFDDRRVFIGGSIVNCNGQRWRYAPKEYGPKLLPAATDAYRSSSQPSLSLPQ